MTNAAQIAQIVAAVLVALNSSKAAKKAPSFKAKSSYKPANKFTPKGKISSEGRTDRQLRNEVAVAKAFKKKGLLVTPRVDAMTWKEWQRNGFTVKHGEKGTVVPKVGVMFTSAQVSRNVPISLITGQPVEAVIQ